MSKSDKTQDDGSASQEGPYSWLKHFEQAEGIRTNIPDFGPLLKATFMGESRGNGFGWEMQKYMDESGKQNPSYRRVDMNQIGSIDFSDSPDEEAVFTFGLCGCTAVACVVEREDGTKRAVMLHADPIQWPMLGQEMVRRLHQMGSIKGVAVIYSAPGEWGRDEGGQYNFSTKPDGLRKLEDFLRKLDGLNVTGTTQAPYSENKDVSKKDQGTLRIVKRNGTFKWYADEYDSGEIS